MLHPLGDMRNTWDCGRGMTERGAGRASGGVGMIERMRLGRRDECFRPSKNGMA
jgi:hypothetical protein